MAFASRMMGVMTASALVVVEIQRCLGQMEGYARAMVMTTAIEEQTLARIALAHLDSLNAAAADATKINGAPNTIDESRTEDDAGEEPEDNPPARLSDDSEVIAIAEAITPPINVAAARVAGLIAGLSSFLEQLLGVDAVTVLTATFPAVWGEIANNRIDKVPPDAAAKTEAEAIARCCWQAAVSGKLAQDQ